MLLHTAIFFLFNCIKYALNIRLHCWLFWLYSNCNYHGGINRFVDPREIIQCCESVYDSILKRMRVCVHMWYMSWPNWWWLLDWQCCKHNWNKGYTAIHNIDLPFIRFECACVREKQHTAMIHCGKIMLCYANNW